MSRYAIILMSSLIHLSGILAGKSDILIPTARESWISMKNFATMLEVSLNESRCCDVRTFGRSVATENLFKEFVKISKFEYTLNSPSPRCNGYLGISTTADIFLTKLKNVTKTTSTTEILLIIDDNIENSSKLFNVSLYRNANVNIVARNGLWTLSVNYLHPRIFKKCSSYHEMEHKRKIIDFENRTLQAATFYNPPFSYLRTTVNKTVNGIEAEFFTADKEEELDGVEMKIFMLIAEKLNFSSTFRKPSKGYRYGIDNGTYWDGGMIGQILNKEVDIAFSNIWIKLDHSKFAKLSVPVALHHIHFLVPRPKLYLSFWALIKPLSPEVWTVIIAMLIVQSLYVYTKAWLSSQIPKRFRSFVGTWTELLGRLLGTSTPQNMHGLELQFQLWHFIGLLLVTAYSSSLAAKLTNGTFEKRIDTIEDLVATNLTWGREGPKIVLTDYFDYSDPSAKEIAERYKREESIEEKREKILKGNYAIIGRIVGTEFFPEDHIPRKYLSDFRLMKQELGRSYSAFAVQPWLLAYVDTVLLQLHDNGLVSHHLNDVLHRHRSDALRDLKNEYDINQQGAKVLKLQPLGAGFAFLIFGWFISTVTFYIELKSYDGEKSISEILLDINKNRKNNSRIEEVERKRKLLLHKLMNKSYVFPRWQCIEMYGKDSIITNCSSKTTLTDLKFKYNGNMIKSVSKLRDSRVFKDVRDATMTVEGNQPFSL